MSSRRAVRRAAAVAGIVAAACVALAVMPPVARGQDAAPDTTLGGYLRSLADSSDAYFGAIAAPTDTAGLDSARAFGLEHPYANTLRPKRPVSLAPDLRFNRVDGPVYGARAGIGTAAKLGKVGGEVSYASGPNRWFGQGTYDKQLERGETTWGLELGGGRRTVTMDRERSDARLSALRAFLNGSDRKQYLQHDGVWGTLSREGATLRLGLGYRNMLETPRVTTATWNLLNHTPEIVDNLQAVRGRASEFEFEGLWCVPRTPLQAQVLHATASRHIGSAFEYRRTLVSAGADVSVGRSLSLIPQAEYGTLNGDALPQEAFYLGGSHTLRSVPSGSIGGSRIAVARVDLITVRDVLALAHLPHPRAFPLEAGVFGGVGAAWGFDPFGGPRRSGGDWPESRDWLGEAGFSFLYQPGIPDPAEFLHLDVAFPLGPRGGNARIDVGVSRALDLLRPFQH